MQFTPVSYQDAWSNASHHIPHRVTCTASLPLSGFYTGLRLATTVDVNPTSQVRSHPPTLIAAIWAVPRITPVRQWMMEVDWEESRDLYGIFRRRYETDRGGVSYRYNGRRQWAPGSARILTTLLAATVHANLTLRGGGGTASVWPEHSTIACIIRSSAVYMYMQFKLFACFTHRLWLKIPYCGQLSATTGLFPFSPSKPAERNIGRGNGLK